MGRLSRQALTAFVRATARCGFGFAFAVAVAVASPGVASAQLLERFEPAPRGSRFFAADSLSFATSASADGTSSTSASDRVRFATGVVGSYATRLRTFEQRGADEERSSLVTNAFWLHAGASVVLKPGVRFALDVPVAIQGGEDATLGGTFFPAPAPVALGDIRAAVDFRILGAEREDRDGVALAAGVVGYVPTGSQASYTGDDRFRVGARVMTSVTAGPFIGAAHVGYTYRRDDQPAVGGVLLGGEAIATLAAGLRYRGLVIGPELYGATVLDDPFRRRNTPLQALLGAHLPVGAIQIGLGVGTLVVSGLGASPIRTVFSVEYAPGPAAPRDRDHDGVIDADDLCPDVPGSGPGAARGCPPPPADRDHDGILDEEDACPDLAGGRTRDVMTNGCPDADHDGVPDPVDACPTIAGERSPLPRFDGCPPDADADGIIDTYDACPDVPGVASDDQDKNGCPLPVVPPDTDGDGIVDKDDACPDRKGVASPDAAANGCPLVRMENDVLVLARPLAVDPKTNKATQDSEEVLAAIATFLVVDHPEIAKVVVDVKAASAKRALVEAQAIADRLAFYGVSKRRLGTRGAASGGAAPSIAIRRP